MPLRSEVVSAVRLLGRQHGASPRQFKQIAKTLEEEAIEENQSPKQIQKLLGSAYKYLNKHERFKPSHPILRGLQQISKIVQEDM